MTSSTCVTAPLPVPNHSSNQPPPSSHQAPAAQQQLTHNRHRADGSVCFHTATPALPNSHFSSPLINWFSPFLPSFLRLLGNQQKKSKRTCDKHILLPLDYTHSGYLDLQTSNSVSWTADKHRERPKSYPALLSSQPTFSLCTVHEICYCTVWGERELIETRCTC